MEPARKQDFAVRPGHDAGRALDVAVAESLAPDMAPALGELRSVDVEVVAVRPGSPAALAFIMPGDLIVAVQDRVVTSVDDIHRLLSTFPLDQPLHLSIIRNEQQLEVEVKP